MLMQLKERWPTLTYDLLGFRIKAGNVRDRFQQCYLAVHAGLR